MEKIVTEFFCVKKGSSVKSFDQITFTPISKDSFCLAGFLSIASLEHQYYGIFHFNIKHKISVCLFLCLQTPT